MGAATGGGAGEEMQHIEFNLFGGVVCLGCYRRGLTDGHSVQSVHARVAMGRLAAACPAQTFTVRCAATTFRGPAQAAPLFHAIVVKLGMWSKL